MGMEAEPGGTTLATKGRQALPEPGCNATHKELKTGIETRPWEPAHATEGRHALEEPCRESLLEATAGLGETKGFLRMLELGK